MKTMLYVLLNLPVFPLSVLCLPFWKFYTLRHLAFNGRGLGCRPVHLQERQHLLRPLCHQVSHHIMSKLACLLMFSIHSREGRATMVSAFASFKFGVAFCFTQLISVLMVFYVSKTPSPPLHLFYTLQLSNLNFILQSSPILFDVVNVRTKDDK